MTITTEPLATTVDYFESVYAEAAGDLAEPALSLHTLGAGFLEASGDDHCRLDPFLSTLLDHAGDGGSGNHDDGEVHGFRHILDAGIRRDSQDLVGTGVHRVNFPRETVVVDEVLKYIAAIAEASRCPDNGNRFRFQEALHLRPDVHKYLPESCMKINENPVKPVK